MKNVVIQWSIAIVLMFFTAPVYAADTATPATPVKTTTPVTTEAEAPTSTETPDKIQTVNTKIIADIDSTIIVKLDGETLESTEVHRTADGNLYVNAMPIFQSLGNDVEYDDTSKALIVRRSQDNVIMELYTETGIVKADGRTLGKLEHYGEVEPEHFILTPNAIAVLAGTAGQFDADSNEFHFKLDPRLRVATGFDIFVDDIPLGAVQPEPKSVGPVLLLPLRPIAEALGNTVVLRENGAVVEVRRVQDSVTMSLNLSTGLVSANDAPVGVSKDVAYIDQANLLLPVSALEALTGTNIDVEAGTDRINVRLDDRLTGSIAPMASVADLTKDTPFTPESLRFQISPDTGARVQFDAHMGRVNGRLRYEIQDLPSNEKELQPNWLSVDFAHTSGLTGSIGDYSADLRELDAVNTRRILGVAGRYETKNGRWAVAVGAPTTGVELITADQSRNTYGGVVAGVRYADRGGWEAGLAVADDKLSGDQRAVLEAISGRLGREAGKNFQWNARGGVGVFNGPARESAVDLRIDADARYRVANGVGVSVRTAYTGAEFLRGNLRAEESEREAARVIDPDVDFEDDTTPPDIRRVGSDQVELSATVSYVPSFDTGFLENPTVSVLGAYRETGVFKSGELGLNQTSVSGGFTTTLGKTGVNLSSNGSLFETTTRNEDGSETSTGSNLSVQAFKQYRDYTFRAQYNRTGSSIDATRESASLNVTRTAFNVPLPKEANLAIGPSVNGLYDGADWRVRGGINAGFSSGRIFGEKNYVSASVGVLQSVSTRGDGRSDKYLTLTAARRLNLGKNMSLGLGYRNDLRGNHRLGLQLDGAFNFNAKRAIKKTQDGRGILKGQVFLDRNRDGIRQATEPGIPRTLVRVKGTPLVLRSGADGFFTIQNVREGLYEVQIDARSLPIGYDLAADMQTRVTIADGQITDIPLAIVQRGQIRGFAFEDGNGNGEYDRGEARIEGAKLHITSDDGAFEDDIITTSFGQYAFDDLPEGTYDVRVMPLESANIAAGEAYTVTLLAENDLMARQNLMIRREGDVQKTVEAPQPKAPQADVEESAPLKYRKGTVTIIDHETPSLELDMTPTPRLKPNVLERMASLPAPRLKPGIPNRFASNDFTKVPPPDIASGAAPP